VLTVIITTDDDVKNSDVISF